MPRQSAADQVIRTFVSRRKLTDQGRLPPERELAAELGLTRGQLRTGLAKLKARGELWGRVGKGTFVGREPVVDPASALRISMLSNPRDIMETRLAIEPTLASLAALRASPNECAHLEKCVRKSREAVDRARFQCWDDEFHGAIARAARNPLLLAIFNAVNESRRRELWGSLRERTLTSARRQSYIAQHAACLAAIKDRDPQRAAAIMRQHLEFVSAICDVFGSSSTLDLAQRALTPAQPQALAA